MDDARQGDRRRWVLEALGAHQAALERYAARMLRDEDAARDCVQHCFLQLCAQSPEAIGPRLVPWLFQVCRNRVVDMIRRRQRTEPLPPNVAQGGTSDPAELAERADLGECLEAALGQLPPAARDALALWSEGLRYRQIADLMGASEGSVRVMVHRALGRLRESPAVRQALGWDERCPADAGDVTGVNRDVP